MKWTGLNELREKYLQFFESKGHLRLPSFSLVPNGDKSLLLINSGMAPMKKYFTGEVTPPRNRVTTCQKCIRTPDIERVGITARHGTYFEMLGNFSFGDYFKHEATAWAWEFCTKVLELPVERIWVSIYQDDDEAFDIWTKEVGVDPSRIVRLGKEDNFWEHGTGPCGPCSELYFDRGEEYGCGSPTCGVGCDCDRYVEFWNLVFSQFDNDGQGNYTPLEHKNIDTGMGLERLACIMQGVDNLFLVDTVQNIMKHISKIAGVEYGADPKTDISLRVVTDHIRSTTFMIGDGVMPSNEGRGYVLRRLLRRAARHGRLLGIRRPFLAEVCDTVINENQSAYPELVEKRDFIKKLISVEEENFDRTIDQGLQILGALIENSEKKILSGAEAFRLNDTYGFPLDLTKEIIAEKGMTVDESEFQRLLSEQRTRARNARKNAGADAWLSESVDLDGIPATEFTGYATLKDTARILAILRDGERVESAEMNDDVVVVLDRTPFYAESGGQVGDNGIIKTEMGTVEVTDCIKVIGGKIAHIGTVSEGSISVGDSAAAEIDRVRRLSTSRNHSATHLLQKALRTVLGTHVEQAGSYVTPDRLRFDFTHFAAMTPEEIQQVEDIVNEKILESLPISATQESIEDARKLGAMALFGEKYGNIVRVVNMGGYSIELCGGAHLDNTAQVGSFKIVSESGIASGVRRIEALTGAAALKHYQHQEESLKAVCKAVKSNPENMVKRVEAVIAEQKQLAKELESLKAKMAGGAADSILANAVEVKGIKLVAAEVKEADANALRTMGDQLKNKLGSGVVVLASANGGKVNLLAMATDDAVKAGAHAGNIIKAAAAVCGGGGGGRPNMAQAGGKDASKITEALTKAKEVLEGQL